MGKTLLRDSLAVGNGATTMRVRLDSVAMEATG